MQSSEIAATVWELPKEGGTLRLITFEEAAPVKTTLTAATQIEGGCVHCQLALKCCAGELEKRCGACPCNLPNSECLTGKGAGAKTWIGLLKALPLGTGLRLEYADPNKSEAGLKHLVVERRKALLCVTGIADATPEELQKFGKLVGASRVERSMDGKRLRLVLKDDWTAERELRLEKALAKAGAKVVSPTSQP